MKLISHRGNNNHKYKENTKEALLETLKADYIDGVELDIRLTKDNKYVIVHNTSYVVFGLVRKFISSITLKEAKKDGLNSLEEFLDGVNTNKIIILDVKKEIGNCDYDVKELIALLKKYNKLNLWICSFCYEIVNKLKKERKHTVGLLISDIINKNKDIKRFDFVSLSRNSYNDIKTNKVKMVWTINKKEHLKNNYEYIITDKAHLLYV
jgi:Glycerophosphoryl diester phosphodiesterase